MGVCVLQIQERKSVDLELTRGRISKLLLDVVIDLRLNLIVKPSILF